MQFDSFAEFLAMGGYGFYVWLSFGITAFAMLLLVLHSHTTKKKIVKQVLAEQARQIRIKAARHSASSL